MLGHGSDRPSFFKNSKKKNSQTCNCSILVFLLFRFLSHNMQLITLKLGRWKLIFWFAWAPAWIFSSSSKVFHHSSQIVFFQQWSTQTWQDWHLTMLKWILWVRFYVTILTIRRYACCMNYITMQSHSCAVWWFRQPIKTIFKSA